jgi:DnaJ-class molecular chaperone
MNLLPSEAELKTKLRSFIVSNFSDIYLKQHECVICHGTGLDKVHKNFDGSYCGDLDSYCYKCGGVGYINYETNTMEKCFKCNGSGRIIDDFAKPFCNFCKGTGFISWIQNILGD